MNVQKVSMTDSSSVYAAEHKNKKPSSLTKTFYSDYYEYKKKDESVSVNHIVTGIVVGGIIGALFSGNTKSALNIVLSSLRGAGIALLGIVSFACVRNFLYSGQHK